LVSVRGMTVSCVWSSQRLSIFSS